MGARSFSTRAAAQSHQVSIKGKQCSAILLEASHESSSFILLRIYYQSYLLRYHSHLINSTILHTSHRALPTVVVTLVSHVIFSLLTLPSQSFCSRCIKLGLGLSSAVNPFFLPEEYSPYNPVAPLSKGANLDFRGEPYVEATQVYENSDCIAATVPLVTDGPGRSVQYNRNCATCEKCVFGRASFCTHCTTKLEFQAAQERQKEKERQAKMKTKPLWMNLQSRLQPRVRIEAVERPHKNGRHSVMTSKKSDQAAFSSPSESPLMFNNIKKINATKPLGNSLVDAGINRKRRSSTPTSEDLPVNHATTDRIPNLAPLVSQPTVYSTSPISLLHGEEPKVTGLVNHVRGNVAADIPDKILRSIPVQRELTRRRSSVDLEWRNRPRKRPPRNTALSKYPWVKAAANNWMIFNSRKTPSPPRRSFRKRRNIIESSDDEIEDIGKHIEKFDDDLNIEFCGSTDKAKHDDGGPPISNLDKRSLKKTESEAPGPDRTQPFVLSPVIASAPHPGPLEARRFDSLETFNPESLDRYLYGPPIPEPNFAEAVKSIIWGCIDPRRDWSPERDSGYLEKRRVEVEIRGNRKSRERYSVQLTKQNINERLLNGWSIHQSRPLRDPADIIIRDPGINSNDENDEILKGPQSRDRVREFFGLSPDLEPAVINGRLVLTDATLDRNGKLPGKALRRHWLVDD
jgi:hypothetical protein